MVPRALFVLLPLLSAPARDARAALPPTPPDVSTRVNAFFAKATPAVRSWVDAEARRLRPLPPPEAVTLEGDARQGFPTVKPPLTPGQADVLAAMAAYQVVNDLDSEARLAPNADALGKIAERKAAWLKLLSSLLRRISETDAAIVANLK